MKYKMNELIQQARELCNKHLLTLATALDAFESYVPKLCDAIEAEIRRNDVLDKANIVAYEDGFNDCKKADDRIIANQRREIEQLTTRAYKAEEERDSYKEAFRNWHEQEGE